MRLSEDNILASITRESFYEFVKEFWGIIIEEEPVWNWHVKYLCDELQEVAERVFRGETKEYDLIVNIAPGSSKSTIVSQMFPAWCWTRFPPARFICASYAKDIALKDSIKTRDIVQSEPYQASFPELRLREDENRLGLFTNTKKGFRYSVGVGGAVTGYHGHFLIVDDPINPEEAFSEPDLATANRWMTNTLPSRKVDKKVSVTILIQQRLHEVDPTGDWLERNRREDGTLEGLRHLCMPAELTYDEDDNVQFVHPPELAEFYEDDLFDPIRMPRTVLKEAMKNMGGYGYAGQMLQSPVPLGGGMFKPHKIKLVQAAPRKMVRMVRSWDKAATEDGGAYSAGVLVGKCKNGFYWILDVKRAQYSSFEREEMIKQTAKLDGSAVEIELEAEGGSGGKESAENTVKSLAGYIVRATHPTGPKEARAYQCASQVEGGNFRCLQKDWTKELFDEMKFFPKSRYKDQIDALSGAFNRLHRKKKVIGARRRLSPSSR